MTRLRRLRGLIATELASSSDHDDVRVIVRRAALSLDSDLRPDPDLLVKAAHGAVWLADLPLADRLAEAAVRAGAGPEPNLVRAHALSWLGRGEEAEAVLAAIDTAELTDHDRDRFAFLRSSNTLWALGDPTRAKELIDEASRIAPAHARTHIDAFLTVYWFAMDQPEEAVQASKNLALTDIPVVGAEMAWALAQISADAGRTAEAVDAAEAGYDVATRTLDAPHMRFNIADAHISALLLAGRIAEALEVAERIRQQAEDLPGAAQLLGAAVAGRAALGAGDVQNACRLLEHAATWVVRVVRGRLGIPLPRRSSDCTRDTRFKRRGPGRSRCTRQSTAGISVAGLRAERGQGVGFREPGRAQRSDRNLVGSGRKGRNCRAIGRRSDVFADRNAVR